jgi:pilus assembly protein CpaB
MKKKRLVAMVVALAVIVAFYGISEYRLNTEMRPTVAYFAKFDIPPHTEITEDMIAEMILPEKGLPPNIIRSKRDIVGKFTQIDYGVTKNSFFFEDKVVTEDELLDAVRMKLKPNQKLWTGDVNIYTSAAGNVIPGSVVEVWLKTEVGGKALVGRLYSDIYVLATKNKKAENIVEPNVTKKETPDGKPVNTKKEFFPTIVQLAVTDEQFQILTAATSTAFSKPELFLVPKSGPLLSDATSLPELNPNDTFDVKAFVKAGMLNTTDAILKLEEQKNKYKR